MIFSVIAGLFLWKAFNDREPWWAMVAVGFFLISLAR